MNAEDKDTIESAERFLVEPPDTGEIRLGNWYDACIHIRELLAVIGRQRAENKKLYDEIAGIEEEARTPRYYRVDSVDPVD